MGRTAALSDVEHGRATAAESMARPTADDAVSGGLLQRPCPKAEGWRKPLASRAAGAEPPHPVGVTGDL
jgi:hypothetical protein